MELENTLTPNQTLYINNLNEKIKSDGNIYLNLELKQNLFQLFSQYGEILEIHSRKSFKMKGQAFVVYKDLNSATNAKHALNNAVIFCKPIVN
jgi:RNA recognition motif-containing protein